MAQLIGFPRKLLSKEHVKKIGNAIWLYLWLCNKITKELPEVYEVNNGELLTASEIADELDYSTKQVLRQLEQLSAGGYIKIERKPYGQIIGISKI